MKSEKVILIILDGWGHGKNPKVSAVAQAKTPYVDSLYKKYPNSELITFGEEVGLPDGQMGNSEVGHLNIGAGTLLHLNSFILRNLTLVQAGLGKLAAFLEKSKGLMIWEDPRASLMFFCLLFAAAIPFAVVIEVLERLVQCY